MVRWVRFPFVPRRTSRVGLRDENNRRHHEVSIGFCFLACGTHCVSQSVVQNTLLARWVVVELLVTRRSFSVCSAHHRTDNGQTKAHWCALPYDYNTILTHLLLWPLSNSFITVCLSDLCLKTGQSDLHCFESTPHFRSTNGRRSIAVP